MEGLKVKLSQMYEEEEKKQQEEVARQQLEQQQKEQLRLQQEMEEQQKRALEMSQRSVSSSSVQINQLEQTLQQEQEKALKQFSMQYASQDTEFKPYALPPDVQINETPSIQSSSMDSNSPQNFRQSGFDTTQIQNMSTDTSTNNVSSQDQPPPYDFSVADLGNQSSLPSPSAPSYQNFMQPPQFFDQPSPNFTPPLGNGFQPMYQPQAPPPYLMSPTPFTYTGAAVTPSAPMAPNTHKPPPNPSQSVNNIQLPQSNRESSKMKQVVMDGEMFTQFMELANPNTQKKIETCGILAGTLVNYYILSILTIPSAKIDIL